MPVERLSFGDLRIEGESRAGEATWIRVHPPGLAFDVGRGSMRLEGAGDLFLSHGHLDHSLGLPYVLSLRTLHHSRDTRVYCPSGTRAALERLIRAAEELEGTGYRYEMRDLQPGSRIQVGKSLYVEAFATEHVLPSLGYHLLREKRRLKDEFQGSPGEVLADLRAQGVEIERSELEIWLTYCGDTGPGVFDLEPRVLASPVLLVECTFFSAESRDNARRFGHMHLGDLIARADAFANQHLVLHHTTRRHNCDDLRRWIDENLPLKNTEVHLFGC